MKKGLKIWRKLLIASLFLTGISTVVVAQNGAATANCGGEISVVTRTVEQLTNGTEISLQFNDGVVGDKYFFVAAGGTYLSSVTCNSSIGANLNVGTITDGTFEVTQNPSGSGTTIPNGGSVTVAVKTTNAPTAGSTLYLGVYIQDDVTSCYSDVFYVRINVLGNIYAYLTLNGISATEYICSGTPTNTNVGLTLCNIPQNISTDPIFATGTLHYTVKPEFTELEGMAIASTGSNVNPIPSIATSGTSVSTDVIVPADNISATTFTLQIGQQTLNNTQAAGARTITYTFVEGLTEFYYSYKDTEGKDVTLPVIFHTADKYCGTTAPAGDALLKVFTVHVAPAFNISTTQYASTERTGDPVTEFCQGTTAYLKSITSATEGAITNWTWTIADGNATTGASTDASEAESKMDDGSLPFTYTATAADDRIEDGVKVGQLVKHEDGVYRYTLVGKWDDVDLDGDATNGIAGHYAALTCTATQSIEIQVTPAPILLLATDKTDMTDDGLADNTIHWNTTDQITAPVVCPGNPINLGVNNAADLLTIGVDRTEYMNTGKYVRDNGNQIKWTISYPASTDIDPSTAEVAAYTEWRPDDAKVNGGVSGNLSTGTTPTTPTPTLTNVEHFLNNSSNGQENIIYTVESVGACKLVKVDGSSLNNPSDANYGQVKIVYPVQPRPQFTLGANN